MAEHTVTEANEDMAGTVVESDSGATYCKPQSPSKSVFTLPSNLKSRIERALVDLGVVRGIYVEAIVQNQSPDQ